MGDLNNKIGKDLLDLYNNGPNHSAFAHDDGDDDEPDLVINAPRKISNKKQTSPTKPCIAAPLPPQATQQIEKNENA
jgi:hypothetical protein